VARYKTVVGDQIRLASLEILKRKVRAVWPGPPAADPVAFVFNKAEIAVLKRLAKGERIVGIDLSQERAVKELAWIARGGEYIDGVTY